MAQEPKQETSAVKAAVNPDNDTVTVSGSDFRELMRLLQMQAQAQIQQGAAIQAQMPVRKVPYSKHEPRSSFAEGKTRKQRAKLTRALYLNGFRVNPKLMWDREIELANKLTDGKFIDGMVLIRIIESSNPGDPDQVHVSYQNKTLDQRFELAKATSNSLSRMFEMCVDQSAQFKTVRNERSSQRSVTQ